MKLGYLQQQIIDLGKKKGFVTSDDVKMFYLPQDVSRQMNKLVVLGYFELPEDCITFIKWKFKNKENEKNGNKNKL